MFRINKMTDYGIVLMAQFARSGPGIVWRARALSEETLVPQPTTARILKEFARRGLLTSLRGQQGGYRLARSPDEISVAEVIEAMEGPLALTECAVPGTGTCETESSCPLTGHWSHINLAVRTALDSVSLRDISRPLPDRREPSAPGMADALFHSESIESRE